MSALVLYVTGYIPHFSESSGAPDSIDLVSVVNPTNRTGNLATGDG